VSRELDRARELRESIHADYEQLIDLQRVFSLVQDVETGARSYALTQDLSFLAPYDAARAKLPGELAKLKGELHEPSQQARAAHFEALVNERVGIASEAVAVAERRSGISPARTSRGKAVMDQIRVEFAAMSRFRSAEIERSLGGRGSQRPCGHGRGTLRLCRIC